MASVRPLTAVADLWCEVKDPATLWGDVSRQTLQTVKCLLENRMHEDLADHLKAQKILKEMMANGVCLTDQTGTKRLLDADVPGLVRKIRTPS